MRVAIVGVTGMVGEIMRNVLEERNFPITEFLPVASARSVGKTITFQGKDYTVIGLEDAVAQAPDFAMFSAGGQTSLDWAPKFAAVGTTVMTIHLPGECTPITSLSFQKSMQNNSPLMTKSLPIPTVLRYKW